ncbi:hypothetical protein FRC10_010735 [Ceratobasidium sp. 414]|nr:hypothetical protein FRC10_010735 [Ceratobasidium sp. 414]
MEPRERARRATLAPSEFLIEPDVAVSQPLQEQVSNNVITSLMSISEVISHLNERGCANITDQLDETSCSKYPIFKGGFGDIYKAKLKSGTEVAIKTMRLFANLNSQDQKFLKRAARELYTWSKCQHRNVQQLLGLVEFQNQIGMVSVWEVNGDLHNYIRLQPGADRCQLSTQIAEGLSYLHQEGIVHGDLKAFNVLVTKDGVPLIVDFGNAILQKYTLHFTTTSTNSAISLRWAAPEVLEGKVAYTIPADVYASGMVS